MKHKYNFIILSILWTTLIWAQTAEISTTLNRISPLGEDWQLTFRVNLNFEPTDGLSFQLPEGISVIPISIQLDDKEIWLQNKMAIPNRDSVITWNFTAPELSFFFRNGLLKNGELLTINCHAIIPQTDSFPAPVSLKEATLSDAGINLSEQDYARGTISLISSQ